MGTALIARGLKPDQDSTALWNLEKPDEVRAVHAGFVSAGARAIQTNTFAANRLALRGFGGADVAECNRAAVALAQEASEPGTLIIGSIGPSGELPPPQGDADLHLLEETFAEQAMLLAEAGVDFLHAETMCHPKELRAVMRGCRQGAPQMPLVVSISCQRSGAQFKSSLGFSAEALVAVALEEKAAGIGANCMLPPEAMSQLISYIVEQADVPVFAKPTIAPDGGPPLYPEEFAQGVLSLFGLGAAAVGGCCGTSAEDIRAAAERLEISRGLAIS
jgi:5-methyltetrahydrofolate--homocysteine methyltransferase